MSPSRLKNAIAAGERSLIEMTAPNWHYNFIPDSIIPALLDSGVSEAEIHQMTVENPRRIFERCEPY